MSSGFSKTIYGAPDVVAFKYKGEQFRYERNADENLHEFADRLSGTTQFDVSTRQGTKLVVEATSADDGDHERDESDVIYVPRSTFVNGGRK